MIKKDILEDNKKLIIEDEETLVNNFLTRIPLIIMIDSYSDDISNIIEGIKSFYRLKNKESKLWYMLDISMLVFGNEISFEPFSLIKYKKYPVIDYSDSHIFSFAFESLKNEIQSRKEKYYKYGREFLKPICVMISDYKPDNETGPIYISKEINFIPIRLKNSGDYDFEKVIDRFNFGNNSFQIKTISSDNLNRFFDILYEILVRYSLDGKLKYNKYNSLMAEYIENEEENNNTYGNTFSDLHF